MKVRVGEVYASSRKACFIKGEYTFLVVNVQARRAKALIIEAPDGCDLYKRGDVQDIWVSYWLHQHSKRIT